MTLILDLPSGVENTLAREALRRGTTPEALALNELRQRFPEPAQPETGTNHKVIHHQADHHIQTGADVIAQWKAEGAFWLREDQPDSSELARQIREAAWRRV